MPIRWPRSSICNLFQIEHPIVQAGMVWVSGAKLAAAAANAGCLGLIGAGSMKPPLLREHIRKALTLTRKPFGINVPLLYEGVQDQLNVALEEGIKIFFTSAGSPKTYTSFLKNAGATVVHVASTPELAKKCEAAGVDAVVVEGFEAGGHNGRDELTTLVLLQQMRDVVKVPVIAAGGIGSGQAIAAAFALGCQGVQIGTLFAATKESSAHSHFKQAMCEAGNAATFLCMKSLVPVRLLLNSFANDIRNAENRCATKEELSALLGKGRARLGMLEGDLKGGELEVGQVVSEVREILSCKDLVDTLAAEYQSAINNLNALNS